MISSFRQRLKSATCHVASLLLCGISLVLFYPTTTHATHYIFGPDSYYQNYGDAALACLNWYGYSCDLDYQCWSGNHYCRRFYYPQPTCPAGQLYTGTSGPGACQPSDVVLAEARAGKNNGCGGGNSSHAGNPCNPANGNKYQVEQDYRSVDGAIIIDRHYNSQLNRDTNFGVGWTSSVHKRLEISGSILVLRRSDGRSAPFVLNTRQWLGDTDSLLSFSQDNNGDSNYFTLIKPNGVREHYETARAGGTMDALDPNGRLVSETSSAGQITNYFYRTDGKLDRVTDPFGHTLTFGYNANGHVSTITDPANKIIS